MRCNARWSASARGVYWRGRATRFGRSIASPIAAVREIVGDQEAVGAAEAYAANLLGLTTQLSPVPVVVVTRRTPTGVGGVRLINRASRTGRRDAHLNDFEVTILEVLDGWDRYVDVDVATATERLLHALARDDVRVGRMVTASRTESSRVRERLRWLLERARRVREATQIEGARSRAGRDAALAVLARPMRALFRDDPDFAVATGDARVLGHSSTEMTRRRARHTDALVRSRLVPQSVASIAPERSWWRTRSSGSA